MMMDDRELERLRARVVRVRPDDDEIRTFLGVIYGLPGDWMFYRLKSGAVVKWYDDGR
ncbi:MAG: hypothetical protein IKG83_03165 [Prevotella sp.]|nr:hypothetical protein [Prevotella sp.]